MNIEIINCSFSVCKVKDFSLINFENHYFFIAKTDEENSLVCPTSAIPENVEEISNGWRAFRIKGVLDFSMIGVLSDISTLFAKNNISIFVISTYNTDYILTKSKNFEQAVNLLKNSGYNSEMLA